LYETVMMALMGIVMFSVVFITYTNLSFLKNRGKEFGMYLTLGMTSKDLTKLIMVENLAILGASLTTGLLSGALFGRLFYMGLNKIIPGSNIAYELNYQSFLLSIGVFMAIFLGNCLFNLFYIRRVSIIDALKSDRKKEVGNSHVLLGAMAVILFILSLYGLPKTLLKEIFKDQQFMIGVFVALLLLCPYFIIGSFIAVIKALFSKFPTLYQKNLLVLSNLSHRYLGYKNMLYMLSLLVAGAMFFVGYSYSLYSSTREYVNLDNPYDIMFIETDRLNKVLKEDVEKVVRDSGAQIDVYDTLDYIEVAMFRQEADSLSFYTDDQIIISESNYNQQMKSNLDVGLNEAVYITVYNENMIYEHPSSILTIMDEQQLEEVQQVSAENGYLLSQDDYDKIAKDSPSLYLDESQITEEKGIRFVNNRHTTSYSLGRAFVVDDTDYEKLNSQIGAGEKKKVHLLNVKNGDQAFVDLINYLRVENQLDASYWNEGNIWGKYSYDERGMIEDYRPIYKEELIKLQTDENGMMFFTMIFIGLLFIIANGIVLYYKVLSDIDDEKERMTSLKRIGILQQEVKSMISKELAITFFIPILFGGGLGLYFLYIMVSNTEIAGLLMQNALIILLIGTFIQSIFYLISRRKYIKEIIGR
ncbi:MAG: FtsX-like permease family protein, partial [Turicibacter sp.]